MTKKPKPTMVALSGELKEWVEHLQQETDIGCALVVAAFLDDTLLMLLHGHLVSDDELPKEQRLDRRLVGGHGGEAPAGSLSAHTALAYFTGLIDRRTYDALDLVRGVRNRFAHTRAKVSFDDQEVRSLCQKLFKIVCPWATSGPFATSSPSLGEIALAVSRAGFTMAGVLLANHLVMEGANMVRLKSPVEPMEATTVVVP